METGTQLAQYRLVERIGEGGMGQVYKALDTRLDREVAVKVLNAEFASDSRRLARFEREAKLLASINHRNIATIYGIDQHDGRHFIAMELIPGMDLDRKLEAGPVPLTEALRIARQIAGALSATHERGVIHRDLKPANVHVTPGGEIKVLDFGIARDAAQVQEDEDGPEPTRPGSILGTVSYMSPEQARGKPVDAATDLWAFGCVLYRMLANRVPFPGDTRWDRLAAVLREEPDWDALPAETPAPIRDLLQRCLVKDRVQRLDDADVAKRVIESVLGISTTTAEGGGLTETSFEVSAPPKKTGGSLRWAMFAVLAAVALWLGYRAAFGPDAGDTALPSPVSDRSVAVLPFENLGGGAENAAFTAGIHDDILNRVAKIGDLRVISRTSVMEYASTTKGLKQIAGELGVAAVLEGGVQRSGSQVRINVRLIDIATEDQLWTESFDRQLSAEELFSIQSDVAGQVAIALQASLSADERRRIDHLPTTNLEAYEAYLNGMDYLHRPGQLEENLIAARENLERAVELDPSFALAYAGLSRAARDHHWLASGGRDVLQDARTAAERAIEIAPDLSEAHLALGTYYYMERDYDDALQHLNLAAQGLPSNSEVMRWKAYIHRRRGLWDEALRELKRARSVNPRDAEAMMEVGFTLLNLRRYDEADTYYCEALDLVPEYPGARIFRSLLPLMRDGSVASAIAAADEIEQVEDSPWKQVHSWQASLAARDFDRAEQIASSFDRIVGQWHDYPSSVLLGWTYLLDGRDAEAKEQFTKAVEILEDDVAARPDEGKLYASLGVAYAGLGRFEKAIEAGTLATELWPIEKDTFVGTWLLHDLGWIHVMAGEYDAAVEAFDRILGIPSVWSIEMLRADPRADPLREHPGFLALVTKYSRQADV